jgi:polysaccharide biosynthesis protein PslH
MSAFAPGACPSIEPASADGAGVGVLFLTTVLPGARRMGSEVASQAVIEALRRRGATVDVLGYVRVDDDYRLRPGETCVGRRHIETASAGGRALFWLATSVLAGLPYSSGKYRSRAYVRAVRAHLDSGRYGLVVLDHAQLGWLIPKLRAGVPVVAMAHNVEAEMYAQLARGARGLAGRLVYGREAASIARLERTFVDAADLVFALTDHDASVFRGIKSTPGEVAVIGLPAAASHAAPLSVAKSFDVGLIGSWTWKANAEALEWFLSKVHPLLPPDCTVHVAGGGAERYTQGYANVVARGFVPSAQDFLAAARVVAIPTLSGGGIQIKTLDAIASGSSIVATPVALRGIDDVPDSVTEADTPRDFAAALVRALSDPGAEISASGRAWARARELRFERDVALAIGLASAAGRS